MPAPARANGGPRPARKASSAEVTPLSGDRGVPPPHDLDAEAAVLSAILLGLGTSECELERDHFYADAHGVIFEAARAVERAGTPVDLVTVAGWLRDSGRLEKVGGLAYLAQISDATPAVANLHAHVERVRDLAARRLQISQALALAAAGRASDFAEVDRLRAELGVNDRSSQAWPAIDVAQVFAPLEPVRYLVGPFDICPGAPALLAGYGYSKKTLAAQSLALAVAAGLPVWGVFAARRGRVLHVDYEQGPRLTRERYQRLALGLDVGPSDLGDRLELVSMPEVYLDGCGLEALLTQRLAGFDLAIIDSLKAACPTIDENDSSVRRVLDAMTRSSERTGCSVVVIHHARKPNQNTAGGAKMAIRGSGAIFDACGSVLVFEGDADAPTRVSHEKARVSGRLVEDFTLTVIDVELGGDPRAGVVVSAETAPSREDQADDARAARQRSRTARVEELLIELFQKEGELGGVDSITKMLGRQAADVRLALAHLVDSGQVEATGNTRSRRHRWLRRE